MADDFTKQLELEKQEQEKKEQAATSSDPYTYTDPNDGTVYDWDHEKKAWFPRVDDDFIARYQQASYNYQIPEEELKKQEEEKKASTEVTKETQDNKGVKRKPNDPTWFQVDDDHNTNVYVSGLPKDITEEEFVEFMQKCGLIMKDPDTMKYKIKLYTEPDGTLKGDGRCCYIKIESVGLALDILDGYLFKGKHKIHVERAQFQMKGSYDPSKKPKRKKKDKEKLKKKMEKLFDWRPDKLRGARGRNENTVIIKNMFDPKEFEYDAALLLDYQKDVREECTKFGEVKKVVIYDRNPEGVVAITFTEPEMADACIAVMNGRWFASRQLTAETWDGKSRYKITETEEELEKRLGAWDKYLEGEEDAKKAAEAKAETVEHSKVVVASSEYEQAGETDSEGDSDEERKVESKANESKPG